MSKHVKGWGMSQTLCRGRLCDFLAPRLPCSHERSNAFKRELPRPSLRDVSAELVRPRPRHASRQGVLRQRRAIHARLKSGEPLSPAPREVAEPWRETMADPGGGTKIALELELSLPPPAQNF
jgi:hypothetical protein